MLRHLSGALLGVGAFSISRPRSSVRDSGRDPDDNPGLKREPSLIGTSKSVLRSLRCPRSAKN